MFMDLIKAYESLKTVNYWFRKPKFNLGYERAQYSKSLWQSVGNSLVKVLVGQRRSGKSFLLRQLVHKLIAEKKVNKKNIFYLNKEMFEFEKLQYASDLNDLIDYYQKQIRPKGKIYIFIDEVQDIKDWEKIVVSLAQHPILEYELFITGSNSQLLSGELASLLSGRYLLTQLYPFSYYEYLDYQKLSNTKENFIKYITTSALPEIFNLRTEETKGHYFQALMSTILLKDIMYRNKIRDYILLQDIFLYLLHNVGNLVSVSSIIKYFKSKNRKADYTTVSQYLTYMQHAFIVSEASRYSFKTKELLSGERKYFISDLGFRNYLFPSLQKDFGSILENIVYTHLRIAGYEVKVGIGSHYEVDFVAQKNNSKQYVQVKII
ncbi:MAG: AAA family ATPase [Bacteroidetes bacterium 4572_77]|nr:MAG: AAA family ATPase [Bacteroidetes bacterium 4572_77]